MNDHGAPAQQEAPEVPLPEQAESSGAEPVVAVGEDGVPAVVLGKEPKPDGEEGPAATEPEEKLEDADPDASAADDDDAYAARMEGLRSRTHETNVHGERARVFQAEELNYFAGEVSARPRHGPLGAAFITKLKKTFARTPGADLLCEALDLSPVQCYVGEPGEGRTTAAIAAAIAFLRNRGRAAAGNVRILASERGLAAIEAGAMPKDSAMILILGPDEPAPELSWLAPIAAELRPLGSVLIVVTATEPVGPGVLKSDCMVRHVPPAPEAVFSRHLSARLEESRTRQILTLPAVSRQVQRCASPRMAAALAADVLSEVQGGVPDDRLLARRDPAKDLDQAADELRGPELWQKSFLICSAVLHRQAAGTATREASRFATLHLAGTGNDGMRRSEWFTGPMSEWSKCVELAGEVSGDGMGRTVRLSHEELETWILQVVWQDHLGERDTLVKWLGPLGHHPRSPVRVKAAHAAARLACYDFDVISREVIQPWAGDGGYRPRMTAAWALEWLSEGRFARKARGLVRRWAREGNVQLRATAIAAYGTLLGANDPDEALNAMRDIVGGRIQRLDGRRDSSMDRAERELLSIVQQALLNVFRDGVEEKIVHELAEWTRLPHWRWRQAAARCLLRLAPRKGRDRGWPRLAELAVDQPSVHDDLVRLWCNALSREQGDEKAWDALHRWLVLAGALPDSRARVASPGLDGLMDRLLAGIRADGPSLAASLDFHLRVWRFRDDRR
ncbi:hypothetical protein ABZU32_09820 [Sphaerisporangium sp. NPDC005288]|uniref:hypothetical protein n=1 Tax=Sphaerisporangium sp. NPDC005288 TaxID=3155114 RepID=UPI0033B1E99F